MKSMEVTSQDHVQTHPILAQINLWSWDDYAKGFIRLKHGTIIDGQLSVTNFDFIWS